MTEFWAPDEKLLGQLMAFAMDKSDGDEKLAENFLYHAIFARSGGMYARPWPPNEWYYDEVGRLQRKKRRISRREWMENYFTIKPKGRRMCLMKLNPPQRRLEAMILKMERANLPVRIIILKARQQGFSTYVQALMFWFLLTGQMQKGLIIADVDERAEMLLGMARTALANMPRSGSEMWDFKMSSRAAYALVWEEPVSGSINIASAQKSSAGRGGTRDVIHITETAFWPEAESKAAGILESLPELPGTYGFNESTANGDSGWFRNEFWDSWKYRAMSLKDAARQRSWISMFFGWWEHPDYCWSKSGACEPVPPEMEKEILSSLSEEEEWLLSQQYFKRWSAEDPWEYVSDGKGGVKCARIGIGWTNVSVDQLAWRRKKIKDAESRGGEMIFNQENPSRPDVAFLSSGRRVFNPDILERYMKLTKKPVWTGTLEETADSVLMRGAEIPIFSLDVPQGVDEGPR